MAAQRQAHQLKLKTDFCGRIANLALAPNKTNTLLPLFEALMNSLHAVQGRFGRDWGKECRIKIEVLDGKAGDSVSCKIQDNGIGLDEQNFDAFLTSDTRLKASEGGKGVGRLSWLKVFDHAQVSSIFKSNSGIAVREFKFVLDNDNTIRNYLERQVEQTSELGTKVRLSGLKSEYSTHFPKNLKTLTQRIAAHFLPYLIGDEKPDIEICKANNSCRLADVVIANVVKPETETFQVESIGTFAIKHLLLDQKLTEKGAEHTLYLSAHGRIVAGHGVKNQTGLDSSIPHENRKTFYVGIVSGEYLNANVTQERNNFDIPKEKIREITKQAEICAKGYLEDPIDRVIEAKVKTIENVISSFPRYGYLATDRREFAKNKLALNRKTEEDVYRECPSTTTEHQKN